MAVDVAFYTTGDTRNPNSLPTTERGSAPRDGPRVPHLTVSDAYRAYCTRLVGPRGGVFAAPNSAQAANQLTAWLAQDAERRLRNVYLAGHGNRKFAWTVHVSHSDLEPVSDLGSAVRHFLQDDSIDPSSDHYRFIRTMSRAMDAVDDVHSFEIRACYLEQSTVNDLAQMVGHAASRGVRVELRGYSDFYAVIPDSQGGFRSEVQDRARARTLARASGTSAPRAQLFACVPGDGTAVLGRRCR